MDPNYISELAQLFRRQGDAVLDGEIKFSVSGQMLRALNDSFSLIVRQGSVTPPGGKSRDFIVTAETEARSSVFVDLQLIFDFVQTLTHLHINQLVTDDDVEGAVDLVNFRNLQKIEIQKLPVRKLINLRRAQLRELSCQQCLRSCEEILGEHLWKELRVLNFSHNALERIDDSVRWTPWVHSLNLSHNRLTSVALAALKFLPHLKSLDLSYNRLEAIPTLAGDASRKLQCLKLQGNIIKDISGVANFDSLMELDLSANLLLFEIDLIPLSVLASLRSLSLLRNPLAFTPRHRMAVMKYLHDNTSTVKFILNGEPTSRLEKRSIGGMPLYHSNARRQVPTPTSASSSLTNSVNNLHILTDKPLCDRLTDSTKKRSRVREIMLCDDLNGPDDEPVVVGSPARNCHNTMPTSCGDHLETKKQIEALVHKFGQNWLNADGENIVKTVFPQDEEDQVRRKFLIDELNNDDSVLSSTPKEGMASRLEITEEHLNSTAENYGTASERTAVTESTTAPYESALSKAETSSDHLTGLDFFHSQQSVEEDVPEPNEREYRVEKLAKAREAGGGKLVVVVSDLSIKEKDPVTSEVLNRWGLAVLESCERPNERNVISIQFNTMRSDKRQRFYLMQEEKECLELLNYLRDILANRDWDEFNQAVYRCASCTTQFCIDKRSQKRVQCPECQNMYVIEITETTTKAKNPTVQKVRSQEQQQQQEEKTTVEAMVKSNSHSSIGSAASLNESSSCSKISNPPASSIDSNESVAGSSTSQRDKDKDLSARRLGMDSDVEVLSNPSQSSIEVLNSCSKNSSRKHSSEERRHIRLGPSSSTTTTDQLLHELSRTIIVDHDDDDDNAEDAVEHVLDTTNVAVANKLLGNCQLQALTESSSSGSITESVCTQYEPVAVVEEHQGAEAGDEELDTAQDQQQPAVGFKKSSSTFLEGFLSASNMLKTLGQTPRPADGIRLVKAEPFLFSTTHFSRADHRLQLYLHQNVFLEKGEKFVAVVRGTLVGVAAGQLEEDAIVVLSNRLLYLFVVTAAEEDDDPGQWMRLMRRVELKEWTGVRVLPSEMGVRFCFVSGNSEWNVMLQDGQHTRRYVEEVVVAEAGKVCEEEMCMEVRRKLMGALGINEKGKEGDGEEKEEFLIVTPLKSLTKIVNENAQSVDRRSALVVTSKRFAVLAANWSWLVAESSGGPEVKFELSLTDMVECEVRSETEFVLNFMDAQEVQHELWCLEFETSCAAQRVFAAIKGPWERVFEVPLGQK